jgi:hypothetical protein
MATGDGAGADGWGARGATGGHDAAALAHPRAGEEVAAVAPGDLDPQVDQRGGRRRTRRLADRLLPLASVRGSGARPK